MWPYLLVSLQNTERKCQWLLRSFRTICVMEYRHGFNLSAATSEENQDISRRLYIACRLDIKREFRELLLCMARRPWMGQPLPYWKRASRRWQYLGWGVGVLPRATVICSGPWSKPWEAFRIPTSWDPWATESYFRTFFPSFTVCLWRTIP